MSAFEEIGLAPELISSIEEEGWMLPTPVQAEAIPLILGGGDVMAAAETGSGKTGAFALPVLQVVHESMRAGAAPEPTAQAPTDMQVSSEDRDALLAVSEDGLKAQARHERFWAGGRGTFGALTGRHYYEVSVSDEGLVRVGWATKGASLDLGTDKQGWGFGGTGKKSNARQFDSYGESYGFNDVVGCLLDRDAGTISYSKNGVSLGVAFTIPTHLSSEPIFPALCLKNAEATFNFGAGDTLKHLPEGFNAIANAASDQVVSALALKGKKGGRLPKALILEPARDLAEQTANCISHYGKYLDQPKLLSSLFVGGVDAGAQMRALRDGVDIVTGTPGRVIDFVESGKLDLSEVRFFVLDEADRLLDTGNQDAIMKLFQRFPKAGTGTYRLQVLMFSATLHAPEIKDLSAKICQTPTWVDLKGKDSVPDTVHHVIVKVDPSAHPDWHKLEPKPKTDNIHSLDSVPAGPATTPEASSEAIKRIKPHLLKQLIDEHKMTQCIIFCRTNFDVDNLEAFLTAAGGGRGFRGPMEKGVENPYSCVALAGGRSMDERRRNLEAFKSGDVRFLICTDVAARGLDIKELPYVINLTLPDKSEDYVHRIGRVGRADTMGLAISLVATEKEKVWYCSKKGYKPWLNPQKADTKTNEQGGHTIWYDEPELLTEVEKRIHQSIPTLGPDLKLPEGMGGGADQGEEGGTTIYGKARGGGTSSLVTAHLEQLKPTVTALARMEVQAQHGYWSLKRKWGQ